MMKTKYWNFMEDFSEVLIFNSVTANETLKLSLTIMVDAKKNDGDEFIEILI